MSSLNVRKLLSDLSHHAFLILGNEEKNYDEFRLAIRKKVSAGEVESADVWTQAFDAISIDDARQIKDIQKTRPIGERRVILISLQSIQVEAQNSLLKLFEEPSSDVTFFVCARSQEIFLPTFLSRFQVVDSEADSETLGSSMRKFLAGTIQDRLAIIEPIVKEKDRALAESFLNDLELALNQVADPKFKSQNILVFENIFSSRRFLRSRSPSVKMILENLCGIVPTVSGVKG